MAGFKNLEDLVSDLSDGLRKLRAGELEPEELTPLVEDARELSDRLILLRFKAHEFSYEVRRKAPESGVDRETADRPLHHKIRAQRRHFVDLGLYLNSWHCIC